MLLKTGKQLLNWKQLARQIIEPEVCKAEGVKYKKDCLQVLNTWAIADSSVKGYKSMKLVDLRAQIVKYFKPPHNKNF